MNPAVEHPISSETLLSALRWRYATKKFAPGREIPEAAWKALEQSLVLAPSSYGLQPWKFFVVDDPALRARLKPASWNQAQITDASRLVVFAGRKGFSAPDVERFAARIAEVRGTPSESLEAYKKMMLGSLSQPPDALRGWIARQVYLALGVFLASAAALGVDACPMEGIDPAEYDRILGLPEKGYNALVVATAGYRAEDDAYARSPKVRYPAPEVIAHL